MIVAGVTLTVVTIFIAGITMTGYLNFSSDTHNFIVTFNYLSLPIFMIIFVAIRYKEILVETIKKTNEVINLNKEKLVIEREKHQLIEKQKKKLEDEVKLRTAELASAYDELKSSMNELKSMQTQLIQQEKLASLGHLTSGIAHEIKNPLNFVNNFSEVSLELVEEAREELSAVSDQLSAIDKGKVHEALDIIDDIEANLRKIHEHGSRADSIVKSMLQHSRGGDGKMEPTPLNSLVKEYVNLAFHGMRAGKDPINVDIDLQLDESIDEVPLIAEDFSRVILNVCNNAFDAMREKLTGDWGRGTEKSYLPKLTVRTKSDNGKATIEIEDNGPGISNDIKDKILQPFFTTKKGTQGTGLGLSITNDIVKAHGGTMDIQTKPGQTIFTINLKV